MAALGLGGAVSLHRYLSGNHSHGGDLEFELVEDSIFSCFGLVCCTSQWQQKSTVRNFSIKVTRVNRSIINKSKPIYYNYLL